MPQRRLTGRLFLIVYLVLINCMAIADASIIALLNKGYPPATLQNYEEALNAGADLNEKDSTGQTALILAVYNNKKEVIEFLIKNGVDVNRPGKGGETALMFAVRADNLSVMRQLFDAGADPNAVNSSGISVLNWASQYSELATIDLLVEKGARNEFVGKDVDPDAKDSSGTPLLIKAVLTHQRGAVEYLLRKGANPNCRDAEESTPLIRAYYSYQRVAPLLIKYGADVKQADNWQRTPLHVAAKNSEDGLLALIEAGAEIEVTASGSYTPLMYAFTGSFPDNAALLLERGANIRAKDYLGREPLHLACLNHNLAGIYFAVEAGAEIEARDSSGNTPLLTIFRTGTSRGSAGEIVDYLISKGADINAIAGDGKSVLQLAERSYDPSLLAALIERGARLSFPDSIPVNSANATATFLLHCIDTDRLVMARFLAMTLSKQQAATKNVSGETALHLAVRRGNDELLQTLLQKGFDPNLPRDDGATPLHLAIRNFNKELVPHLLRAGARPDIADNNGETALTWADKSGDSSLYELLLNFSQRDPAAVSALAATNASETSLLNAIKNNRRLTIERLLKESPNAAERDEKGNTPLHFSISRYSREWATTLLNAGADPAAANEEGTTPLHLAAREGNLYLARLFLDCGAPVDIVDAQGRTPLFHTVKSKNLLMLELLLKRGANINKSDKDGTTPLFQAINADPYLITFSWLVKRGATVEAVDRYGRTVFHELMNNRPATSTVEKLLRLGLSPLTLDKWGESPLSIGLKNGSPEIVDYMFAKKPDFSAIASAGASILHDWAVRGKTELLARAFANGADPDQVDRNGEPLLFAALQNLTASPAALIINAGAKVDCTTASGVTLLESAILKDKIEHVRCLLAAGANPNWPGSSNILPLWLAVGRWEIFNLLLAHGAQPDLANLSDEKLKPACKTLLETSEGVAALRVVAEKGVDLRLLVFTGSTPEEQNKQIFSWAWAGKIDSVKLAVDLGFDLKTTNKYGCTLLHRAAYSGKKDMTSRLIEWGAPLEALNNEGETPLAYALTSQYHDAVIALLDGGASTKAVKEKKPGSSPLHLAAYNEASPPIIDRLIKEGYPLNGLDAGGGTPLHWATEGCAAKAVSYLLELGADPNIATVIASSSTADKRVSRSDIYTWNVIMLKWKISGITPLARAVVKKSLPMTQELLEHGARLDIADELGNTPLHLAFIVDEPGLAELMLAYNPPVLVKNLDGHTPIDLADKRGFTDLAFALWKTIPSSIKQDPNESSQPASTPFPLHDAVMRHETTQLRWLLRQGNKEYALDDEKHTPLWVAVDNNRLSAAKILLQHGASPNYAPSKSDSPWMLAVRAGKTDFVEAFASAGVDINSADKAGDTALHFAARGLHVNLIEFLLRQKALPGACNNLGRTPLMEAILQNEYLAIQAKIDERRREINAKMLEIKRKSKNKPGWNPFRKVPLLDTRSRRTKAIEALAIKDQSIMTADIYGQTVLHLAARNSSGDLVKLLVSKGSDLEARDRNGRTAIFHAIVTGNSEAVTALIDLGAALNIADNRGETPLSLTDALNRAELRKLLAAAGAPAESIVPQWSKDSSQLQAGIIRAVGENRPEAVRCLLDQGANLDETDIAGETSLFHAVRAGNLQMVELLLARGADNTRCNGSGQKPLDLALELSRKAGRESQVNDDTRALITAAEEQHNWVRIIELLQR